MSTICNNCLVELDDQMEVCPLCGLPANAPSRKDTMGNVVVDRSSGGEERLLMQRILWQVTSMLLFSGILATLIIDYAVHRNVTWSVFPITICLVLLSYASLFAFSRTRLAYRLLAGWLMSAILLVVMMRLFKFEEWIGGLAMPLLFAANITILALMAIFAAAKQKSLNLFAWSFVAMAVLCLVIEAIISRFLTGEIALGWSIIVAACLLPVTAALIFMFYRTRHNPTIQKIFHT